jgi:multisubunit Na+/H+ antiporter MnhB subunit
VDGGDGEFFGSVSPAAFAAMIVGAVAVALLVIATRKKPESSSTGLIESE